MFKNTTFRSSAFRPGAFLGRPPIALGATASTTGAIIVSPGGFGGTSRVQMQTMSSGCSDISFVFTNYANGNGFAPGAFDHGESIATLIPLPYSSVYLEYNGVSIQLFVNGSPSFTVAPGALVVTDALKVAIPANTVFFVRYFLPIPNSSGHVPNFETSTYLGTSGTWSNAVPSPIGSDIASGTGTAGLSAQTVLGAPAMAIGTPVIPASVIVGVHGDSIAQGLGGINAYHSHFIKPLVQNGIPFVAGALQGNTLAKDLVDFLIRSRNIMFAECSAILSNIGTNDMFFDHPTNAQMQSRLITFWQRYQNTGIKIFHSTFTSRNGGSFATTGGQTTLDSTFETQRQFINKWLRAPASAGAGQSAIYDAGGALSGVIDAASYVETDITNATPGGPTKPNLGGLWYCGAANNTAYTSDGTHPNDLGYTLMSQCVSIAQLGTEAIFPTSTT